jgi:hypothetical protein
MLEGCMSSRDRGFQKILFIGGEEVVVTFIHEANKLLTISNAWVKTI